MINLASLTIAFSGRAILDNVSWHISEKDRIGLVGMNGSGKSTLMKIIAGEMEPDGGEVVMGKGVTVGYLPQDGVVHEGRTLFDEVKSVFDLLESLKEEETELFEHMKHLDERDEAYHETLARYGEIHERLQIHGVYNMEERIEKVLTGLGFERDDFSRTCNEFSGGWQMRIALGKILLSEPNLLLLDEPTNYLDIEARVFLQQWLADYPFAVLLVSHDRHFLDQVVGRITDIHDGRLEDYHCNYSRYLVERQERVEKLKVLAERRAKERERIETFINRFRYKADKASLVQSRVKMLEKLDADPIVLPSVRKKIRFHFPQPERSGKIVIDCERLAAGYEPGKQVFHGVDFKLMRGDKVALVGVNGAGKTTLIKTLAGLLTPEEGAFHLGHNVDMDYFAQEVHKQLDPDKTVYQTLEEACPFDLVPKLRSLLGAFLFSGDDVEKPVSVLSGGERNRLALARMLLIPSNLLLMDEPTNHLDIDAKDVLLDALQRFEGTLLFVSHDRYFLDELATKVYALDEGELFAYPGGYSDFLGYMERKAEREAANPSAEEIKEQKAQEAQADEKQQRVLKYQNEKKRKRETERLEKLVAKLEGEIEQLEEEVEAMTTQMALPKYATDFGELEKLVEKRDSRQAKLDTLHEEWAQAAERLEAMQAEAE